MTSGQRRAQGTGSESIVRMSLCSPAAYWSLCSTARGKPAEASIMMTSRRPMSRREPRWILAAERRRRLRLSIFWRDYQAACPPMPDFLDIEARGHHEASPLHAVAAGCVLRCADQPGDPHLQPAGGDRRRPRPYGRRSACPLNQGGPSFSGFGKFQGASSAHPCRVARARLDRNRFPGDTLLRLIQIMAKTPGRLFLPDVACPPAAFV